MAGEETTLTATEEVVTEPEGQSGNEWQDTPPQSDETIAEPETTETPAAGLTPEEQSAKDKAYAEAAREKERADRAEAELAELRARQAAPAPVAPREPTADPELDAYAAFLDSKVYSEEISAYQAKQYLADKKAELTAQRQAAAEQDALRRTVIYTQAMVVGTAPQQEFKAMLADANVGGVAAVPGSELHNEVVAHFKAKGVDISNPASFVAANGLAISPEIILGEVLAAKLMADYRVKSRNKPKPGSPAPALPRATTTSVPANSATPRDFAEATARLRAEYPD